MVSLLSSGCRDGVLNKGPSQGESCGFNSTRRSDRDIPGRASTGLPYPDQDRLVRGELEGEGPDARGVGISVIQDRPRITVVCALSRPDLGILYGYPSFVNHRDGHGHGVDHRGGGPGAVPDAGAIAAAPNIEVQGAPGVVPDSRVGAVDLMGLTWAASRRQTDPVGVVSSRPLGQVESEGVGVHSPDKIHGVVCKADGVGSRLALIRVEHRLASTDTVSRERDGVSRAARNVGERIESPPAGIVLVPA